MTKLKHYRFLDQVKPPRRSAAAEPFFLHLLFLSFPLLVSFSLFFDKAFVNEENTSLFFLSERIMSERGAERSTSI